MFENITLKEKKKKDLNVFVVVVESDENDANYLYSTTQIDAKEVQKWIPALKVVKQMDRFDLEDIPEELHDMIHALVPTDSEGECHSINIQSIEYIDENGIIWDAELS